MTTASLQTRFGSYPLIMAAVIAAVGVAPDAPAFLLWLSMTAELGLSAVALLERFFPLGNARVSCLSYPGIGVARRPP